jgi:hypothetical protein
MTDFILIVTVEEKEDVTLDNQEPELPTGAELAVTVHDHMADITKHEAQLGWRITAVRPG